MAADFEFLFARVRMGVVGNDFRRTLSRLNQIEKLVTKLSRPIRIKFDNRSFDSAAKAAAKAANPGSSKSGATGRTAKAATDAAAWRAELQRIDNLILKIQNSNRGTASQLRNAAKLEAVLRRETERQSLTIAQQNDLLRRQLRITNQRVRLQRLAGKESKRFATINQALSFLPRSLGASGFNTFIATLGSAGVLIASLTAGILLAGQAIRGAFRAALRVGTVAINSMFFPLQALRQELTRLTNVRVAIDIGRDLVQSAATMDGIRRRIGLLLNVDPGDNAVSQELKRLGLEADTFGTRFVKLSDQFSKVAFASQQMGIEVNTIRTLFQGFGAASGVLGLDEASLTGFFKAITDAASKGRLQSEELTRQLANALPASLAIVGRGFGFTNENIREFRKLIEEGRVGAKEFIGTFANQLVKEFFDDAVLLSTSLRVNLERIANAADKVKVTLGELVALPLLRIVAAFDRVRASFDPLVKIGARLKKQFTAAIESINFDVFLRSFRGPLQRIIPSLEKFTAQWSRLVVFLNTVAVGAITEIAGRALGFLTAQLGRLQASLEGVFGVQIKSIADAFTAAGAVVQSMPYFIDILALKMRALFLTMQAGFEAIKTGLRGMILAVTTLNSLLNVTADLVIGVAKAIDAFAPGIETRNKIFADQHKFAAEARGGGNASGKADTPATELQKALAKIKVQVDDKTKAVIEKLTADIDKSLQNIPKSTDSKSVSGSNNLTTLEQLSRDLLGANVLSGQASPELLMQTKIADNTRLTYEEIRSWRQATPLEDPGLTSDYGSGFDSASSSFFN